MPTKATQRQIKPIANWFFLLGGTAGLAFAAYLILWTMWLSATPHWQTHAEPISTLHYLAILTSVFALGFAITGALGLWKSKANATQQTNHPN